MIPAGAEIYSFVDTARFLQGNDVYRYAVRTVNDVDQLSDFSESASASPGKKATVGSPMNLRITRTDKGVLLVWDDMRPSEPYCSVTRYLEKRIRMALFTLIGRYAEK